ncbi:MAG TPA: DUF4230 domain-containing protein [Gemmatimonadaceae bacterium]|nr:DUF4230 domain-containing protein [Gemmatimonadaceae bacterium]
MILLRPGARWLRPLGWLAAAAALLIVLVVGIRLAQGTLSLASLVRAQPPQITHDLVVERVQDVAKLVSTQMTVRDVVVYEQTRFASTKRALLVVTGRVLAGIDLQHGTDVRIDHAARRITITLPPARVLAVDVIDVRTYDESAGLLNPFRPEDRDAIQRQIRHKLLEAGQQSGLLTHADSSARVMLQQLLARDGYTVDVVRSSVLVPESG